VGDGGTAPGAADAVHQLRRSARRIGSALHTYGALTDPAWSEPLRAELGWLASTLAREYQHSARLARLMSALHRLSAAEEETEPVPLPVQPGGPAGVGPLAVGGARAGALLERQITLARTRAHSAALQAMGSSRFHAVADAVAVLASEVSLASPAEAPAGETLPALTERAHARLAEAAGALPLARAGQPYNGDTLRAALTAEMPAERQDAPWHRVRILLRLSRYAREVFPYDDGEPEARPGALARVLEQHRGASEAAAAVTAAARTPRIAPATAYALGVLHADQRQDVEEARFAFAHLWQRA
jgi:CHAD domain-containing protein